MDKASGVIDAIDDEEYSGGLVNLLQDSICFVSRNKKKAWRETGNGRLEMPDYLDMAVLEEIVNALIHRDYLELGSEVHIDMFDDRMEIYSLGGMPDGHRVQDLDLRSISSRRRNPIIADKKYRLKTKQQLEKILKYLSEQSECSCRDICMLLEVKERRARQLLQIL